MADPTGLTWQEWVQHLAILCGIGMLTENDIEWLLWEETAWPMADIATVEQQLRDAFTRIKSKGTSVPKPAELEIHEPVDEVPPASRSPRASRWDAVMAAAVEADGKWVPVTKPPGYTKSLLTDRYDSIVVEPRGDKIYVKYDPDEARRRRNPAARTDD